MRVPQRPQSRWPTMDNLSTWSCCSYYYVSCYINFAPPQPAMHLSSGLQGPIAAIKNYILKSQHQKVVLEVH